MYAHKVIEGMNDFINMRGRFLAWHTSQHPGATGIRIDKFFKQNIKDGISGIKKAQKFHISSNLRLSNMFNKRTNLFNPDITPFMVLPYPITWIDCYMDNPLRALPEVFKKEEEKDGCTYHVCRKRGYLIEQVEDDLLFVRYYTWFPKPINAWVMNLFGLQVSLNIPFVKRTDKWKTNLGGEKDNLRKVWLSSEEDLKDKMGRDNDATEITYEDLSNLTVIQNFLLFLNSSKTYQREHKPPIKLQSKRKKSGKQELFTYKTLVIKIPIPKDDPEIVGINSGITMRRHLVRSHPKFFGPPGMFGKYVGLYFWRAHWRGTEQGFVWKEYEI